MPHYKCTTCRTRLQVSGSPAGLVGDLCPQCGSLLEPARLQTLVGYAAIERSDESVDVAQAPAHQRIADRVDEFMTRRNERLDRERLEAELWHDGDDPVAAAGAIALPRPPR